MIVPFDMYDSFTRFITVGSYCPCCFSYGSSIIEVDGTAWTWRCQRGKRQHSLWDYAKQLRKDFKTYGIDTRPIQVWEEAHPELPAVNEFGPVSP